MLNLILGLIIGLFFGAYLPEQVKALPNMAIKFIGNLFSNTGTPFKD